MQVKQGRRHFLKTATAAVATAAFPILGANDRVNLGIVGLGGRGRNHVDYYSKLRPDARIAAVCDVNQSARERAIAQVRKLNNYDPKEFTDMRTLFASKDVDAVSLPLPNHWHALATIWACQAGKDVYVEKPAAHNLFEAQQAVTAARKYNRMVQVGSQSRSITHKMRAVQLLEQGEVGQLYHARGLCFRRRFSIGHTPDQPVPTGLDWDLFLGPAQYKPYSLNKYNYNWHWFWDTGNGDIGNQGVHEMGIARWGLGDPEWPKTAVSFGGKLGIDDDTETPNMLTAAFNYGDRQLVFEVRGNLTGGEGTRQGRVITAGPAAAGAGRAGRGQAGAEPPAAPPAAAAPTQVGPASNPLNVAVGDLFYGTEGWAAMSDQGFQAYKGESSELIMQERPERGQPGGDATGLHMQNFLQACKSRNEKDLHDPLSNAILSADLCHMANISYRVGRKLTLETGPKFTGDAEATKMITRPVYRKGYEV